MTAMSRGQITAMAALRAGRARLARPCSSFPKTANGLPVATLIIRPYSSAAEALASDPAPSITGIRNSYHPTTTATPAAASPPQSHYTIQAGIILTRAPLLTRTPTSFESAFWFYQKRLHERLALRFHPSFFFRPDTSAELDWRARVAERGGPHAHAHELGGYDPRDRSDPSHGKAPWLDELRVVEGERAGQKALVDALLDSAVARVSEDGKDVPPEERRPVDPPLDRVTEADRQGDVRRLDRKLDRTLYLVVEREAGQWGFPSLDVGVGEGLHETAARALQHAAGVNMNTWIVGRVPVAFLENKPGYKEDGSLAAKGDKIFFLKGRIMAGQADLKSNKLGLRDFNWLTKEELQEKLPEHYYRYVRSMMVDR